jgi:hypothetical protein
LQRLREAKADLVFFSDMTNPTSLVQFAV